MVASAVKRRCIAISAVNFTEGGPLTVLREFVATACSVLPAEWDIVVFLHDERLLTTGRARLIAIPYAKRGWLLRLYVEWFVLRTYSRELRPDVWVSLHDISPNVECARQVVYCHNPAPFFHMRLRDALFEPPLAAFRLAYKALYRLNINRNYAVIVQQSWLREEFRKWTDASVRIIVAHPSAPEAGGHVPAPRAVAMDRAVFLYPALPRAFKNVELICRAVRSLESNPAWRSAVVLTIDGTENRYARWLREQFGGLRTVSFAGRQSGEQMNDRYREADCLLFPSRLETWGLPITEAKQRGLAMFVADLPYARETVGNYDRVDFIDIADHRALADKLLAFQRGKFQFRPARIDTPEPPFVPDWAGLIAALIEGLR